MQRLAQIPGVPPDMRLVESGCSFAPRCAHVTQKCTAERPALTNRGADHTAACWLEFAEGSSEVEATSDAAS
jgi:oligopeptide/dipeptide ABC transporter ATP-binding protein